MKQKYFLCSECGNLVEMLREPKGTMFCCGKEMKELIPGETDAAVEKHVPIYELKDNILTVSVGEVEHPMIEKHFIEWVSIQTNLGSQMKKLYPGEKPEVQFVLLENENVETIYAYCNIHGLWKNECSK